MVVHFHETQETIDILRRVADKLDKGHGCINADELWKGVQCEPSAIQHLNPTITRQGFRQMEGFLDVLHTLASTFKSHISSVRARVHTPRLTLDNLPDEIILEILGYENMGLRNEDMKHRELGLKSLLRYSHICSRFRNAILSLHSLWAKIPLGLDLSAHIIETIARGSGTLGLTVSIYCCWVSPRPAEQGHCPCGCQCAECYSPETGLSSAYVQAALDVIFKYGERWTVANLLIDDPKSAEYIREHPSYANLTQSSIRTLKVTNILGTMTHYFRNWTMHNLEELAWKTPDTLPLSLRSCNTTSRLSICSLDTFEPKLMDIVAFLTANPSLTRLELRFKTLKFSDLNEPVEPQVASLPNLEHFELKPMWMSTTDSITQLLKSISCHNIRHLSFSTYCYTAFPALAQHIRCHYPILKSVTLIFGEYGSDQSLFFDEILCSMPSTIEKITLISESVQLRSSRRESTGPPATYMSYPNLKALDLEECTYPDDEDFYTNLSEILKKHGVTLYYFQLCGY